MATPRDPEIRSEVAAALAARSELGPAYEEHLAAGLVDRVEELVAYRTAELRQQASTTELESVERASARRQRFWLGVASLTAGIPISAISAATVDPGLAGLGVAWLGIVGVNVVHAWSSRRK